MKRKRKRGVDKPPTGTDAAAWPKQHDAFFKQITPRVSFLKRLVEAKIGLDAGALEEMKPVEGELQSRVVAEALHWNAAWKLFQLDGVFEVDGKPVVAFEYQSTDNKGMLLRVFMYSLAFEEKHGRDASDGPEFVVLYSGDDMPDSEAERLHDSFVQRTVRYLFIDINRLDPTLFQDDDVYARVLRLARRDATNVDDFVRAQKAVDARVKDKQEHDRLLTAIVAASVSKPHLFEQVMKEVRMSNVVRQNFQEAAPVLERMNGTRRYLELILRKFRGPEVLAEIVDTANYDELEQLLQLFDQYGTEGEWDRVVEALPDDRRPSSGM